MFMFSEIPVINPKYFDFGKEYVSFYYVLSDACVFLLSA